MSFPLPPELRAAIAGLAAGLPAGMIGERAATISAAYREGQASHAAIASHADVVAYLVARMPATFAATSAALDAAGARMPGFAPASLIDLCAGPGTASFAALERWPSIERASLIDASAPFIDAARRLGAASVHPAARAAAPRRADLAAALDTLAPADLVMMSYALVELPETALAGVARRAFTLARGLLVLVEPGTPGGTRRILACRDALVAEGAYIVAPCPHALPCPMTPPAWCHFSERLPRSREHLRAKGASVPFEDEPYAYLAVAREPARPVQARLVGRMRLSKVEMRCPACMAEGHLADIVAPRRDREAYARLRRMDWGDAVPSGPRPTSAGME